MPTPAEIIDMSASLMNDTAQTVYTDAAVLPYLNMAIEKMLQVLERNNIPITNETSAAITLPIGTTVLGFATTPALPTDLIEIQQVWESATGLDQWTPMVQKEFIPHFIQGVQTSKFLIYVWMDQEIRVPVSNADNDLKIDYVRQVIATPITIGAINTNLDVINCKNYLGFYTAALCSQFIGENETRANVLFQFAADAENDLIGVSIKGMQSITTRHRPFRSSYKIRGRSW